MSPSTSLNNKVKILGWIALIIGLIQSVSSTLGLIGILPKTDYPIGSVGLALFLGGYITCFIISPLYQRISSLEHRLDNLESERKVGFTKLETESYSGQNQRLNDESTPNRR